MTHVLDTHIASRQIYLHSNNGIALGSGGGEHIYQFDNGIKIPNNMHVLISLVSASIPNTQYTINSTNNKLVVDSTTHTLTSGFYDVDTLSSHLTSLIDNIVVTHSTTTGKFTFTKTSGDFAIGAASTCLEVLGVKVTGQSSSPSSVLVGENVCNLAGLTDVYVQILSLHNENSKQHVVGHVAINVMPGEIAHSISHYKFAVSNKHLQHYHIRLIDQNDNLVDLNNIPYNLVLQLDWVYNKEFKEDVTLESQLKLAKESYYEEK